MTEQNAPNFQEILQTAHKMQQEMNRVQGELAQKYVEASSGGGMVVAVANGRQEIISLRIEKEVVDPEDIQMLQDLIVAAVNQALVKSADLAQQEMGKVTGQMNLKIATLF